MSSAAKIMFVRHAEKPDGVIGGVLGDGSKGKDSLTTTGWQRAGALVVLFGYGAPISAPLTQPEVIYAAAPGGASASQRPIETVSPLAAKLNVPINTTFGADDFQAMLNQALAQAGRTILVCWEHKTLVAGLNATNPLRSTTMNAASIPSAWPGDRFDMVWAFDLQAGRYVFSQVPQLLLSCDIATPIV